MQIVNKKAGKCKVCGTVLNVGEGFAHKPQDARYWDAYCSKHAPEKIEARGGVSVRKIGPDGYITIEYNPANNALLKTLPIPAGCRSAWDPDRKQWRASTAETDRMRVLEICDRLGINVDPSLRGLSDLTQMSMLPDSMYPFQKVGTEWCSRRKRGILGDGMGTGKTIQALMSIGAEDRTLVVCPASLKFNWERECKKWRPDLVVKVVMAGDGKFSMPKAGQIVIMNYDILPKWLLQAREDMPAAVSKLEGIFLICDEAHFCGNKKSQRSRKVTMLSEQFAERVLFLTGTVMTRDPNSMWDVLSAAGVATEAFGSKTRFLKLHGATYDRWHGVHWGATDPIVPELLRRVMLRRTREEVLPDLPRKQYTDIVVNGLSARLRSTLDTIWGDQGDYLETEGCLPDFSEFSKVRAELAAAKIPAMLELVEEHETQGVALVVCSDHLAPVEALEGRAGWAVIKGSVSHKERNNIAEAFQNGTLKGIAFTTATGGTGFTFTHAWKMLMVDLNWSPSIVNQAEDRLVRIGQQSEHVEIARLIVDHPLERHIHAIVGRKVAMIQASVENSVATQKLVVPNGAVNGAVRSETDAEYDARMEVLRLAAEAAEAQAQAEAAQGRVARAKDRVAGILEREQVRNPGYCQKMKPLTSTRIKSIQDGIRYLAGVCDGAVMKDGQGFNKPDAYVGAVLATAGLETEDELRAAELILIRYSKTQVTLAD